MLVCCYSNQVRGLFHFLLFFQLSDHLFLQNKNAPLNSAAFEVSLLDGCYTLYPFCRSVRSKSTGEDARGYEFPRLSWAETNSRRKSAQRANSRRRTGGGGGGKTGVVAGRIMTKTMSREIMRGADERRDDDVADDDGTKAAVLGRTGKNWGGVERGEVLRRLLRFPRHGKSCHLATSCLFSTSQWPEGDKQSCCLIGNRCHERGTQRKRERERERLAGIERHAWKSLSLWNLKATGFQSDSRSPQGDSGELHLVPSTTTVLRLAAEPPAQIFLKFLSAHLIPIRDNLYCQAAHYTHELKAGDWRTRFVCKRGLNRNQISWWIESQITSFVKPCTSCHMDSHNML